MNLDPDELIPSPSPLAKLLTAGLVGWASGLLILLAASWPLIHPEVFATAIMWAISHWWIAFAFGAAVLLVRGLLAGQPVGTALFAYLLPVAILLAISGVFIAIYPDAEFRSDLIGYLTLMLVFQTLGLIWMATSRKTDSSSTRFLRAVLPAVIGGITIIGMIAVPVFKSNAFIYRNAFDLTVSKTSIANGLLLADGVLEINKPGAYEFSSPRYTYPANDIDPSIELGKITWGAAGEPKNDATGSFPFQIRWEKGIPDSLPEFVAVEATDNLIYIEARAAQKPSGEPLYTVTAPIVASTP